MAKSEIVYEQTRPIKEVKVTLSFLEFAYLTKLMGQLISNDKCIGGVNRRIYDNFSDQLAEIGMNGGSGPLDDTGINLRFVKEMSEQEFLDGLKTA